MEVGRHRRLGEVSANLSKNPGKHRAYNMDHGIGFIPLGNRRRDSFGFGENVLEERDSIDISTSKRR